MAWLKKKADPISERAQSLNSEIAALEAEIRRLDGQLQRGQPQKSAAFRSTALPQGATVPHSISAAPPPPAPREPVFEEISQERLKSGAEQPNSRDHYNEFGVRKYDLIALARRARDFFQGPSTANPKLVTLLAAGGIHGLRPMRYEKRVARYRVILLTSFLLLMLLGILWVAWRR